MSHEDTKISKGCATGGKVIPIILETSIVKTSFPPEVRSLQLAFSSSLHDHDPTSHPQSSTLLAVSLASQR